MSECFDINSLSCRLIVDMDQASCKMDDPAFFTSDDGLVDLTYFSFRQGHRCVHSALQRSICRPPQARTCRSVYGR